MSFVVRILNLIENKGVSAYELAKAVGISQATITKWKKGENVKPRQETLKKLAEYFNVSEDWLRTGREVEQYATNFDNTSQVVNEDFKQYSALEDSINSLIKQNDKYLSLIETNTELITTLIKTLRI